MLIVLLTNNVGLNTAKPISVLRRSLEKCALVLANENIIAPMITNAKRRKVLMLIVLLIDNVGLNTARLTSVRRKTMEKCAPVTSNANQSLVQADYVRATSLLQ